ncbi:hypothetical protein ACP4OV_003463 [Aristida adscensionis]
MPPSPSIWRSPKEISHRRGHSFGSILPAKSMDDELLLFTDMQKHERDNFLLEPAEDFDESISKLSYFRDSNARGENRDLLNVDGDRKDYDWLLTPPDTPLFRSLDDEENQRINLAHRGRSEIKPKSISRSSTMEINRRSNRSSASPSRLSPLPRSCSSTVFTRTRSSNSSSRCSPPLSLQPSTPTWRSSTPPACKTLTPPRRSPSPASRSTCSGSSGPTFNGKRGASPIKANQRSSSPKLQNWQSSDPGFSFDAPPNLRTSLSDRSVSRSRGGSPSSFSGLDMGRRGRRQSVSPTPSRRASSSHSNDRDCFSSYSKASGTSSAEDDLDSLQSGPVSYTSSPAVRKNLGTMKARPVASSKKPSKSFSPSSAPKRSFDSAVWLMDHRKAPQDMFRPLLSSVPSTTFSSGKGDDVGHPILLYNPSVTTSSKAIFEEGATFGPCVDKDQEQHDVVGECEERTNPVIHDDIFKFDKLDELNERPNCHQCSVSTTRSGPEPPSTVKSAESTRQELDMERSKAVQTSCNMASSTEVGHCKMATCTRCGKLFNSMNVDGEVDYCEECASIGKVLKIQVLEGALRQDHKTANSKPCIKSEVNCITPDCSDSVNEVSLDSQLVNDEPQGDYLQKFPPFQSTVCTTEEVLLAKHVENTAENTRTHDIGHSSVGNSIDISLHQCSVSDCRTDPKSGIECDILGGQTGVHHKEMPHCLPESICESTECVSNTHTIEYSHKLGSFGHPNLKAENIEGAGISVLLLQKSGINKWPVVEGRPLAATNILCSELYYTRANVSMLKRTIGCGSSSATSSVDQGSSRQSDVHLECTKSSNQYDFEKAQICSTVSFQSIASMSDLSTSSCSVSLCPPGDTIVDTGLLTDNSGNSASRTMIHKELDGSCRYTLSSAIECWSAAQAIVNDDSEPFGDVVTQNKSTDRMAHNDNLNVNLCSSDAEMCNIQLPLASEESCIQKTEEGTSAITQCNLVGTPEHSNDGCGICNDQTRCEAVLVSNEANKLDNSCVSIVSEEEMLVSATEVNTMEFPGDEESPSTVEGSSEQSQRCFTLEEATDTVLFCSAIVHDIAYKAATIGLEGEQELELAAATRPAITTVGNFMPKGDGLRKLPHRRTQKQRKRSEGETTTETTKEKVVTKEPSHVRPIPEITKVSDSMKPPKLESKCNCTVM